MKAIIDIADDILYKSFYVYGLEKLLGENNVSFSDKPFLDLSKESRNSKSMRFVVKDGASVKRYVISCNDSYKVIEELYNWCDVYGSVNANRRLTPGRFHEKLVTLCPSFAIRCWSFAKTMSVCALNLYRCGSNYKKYLGKHKRLLKRNPYETYSQDQNVIDNYVFHCSTLWYSDEWNKNDAGVNLTRAKFIRSCKSIPELVFEGGLVPQGGNRSSTDLFSDCLSKGCPNDDWMIKTKQSMFVFNTPAFWNCHGWKLGEYMALGKAIISTPLSNDLPSPLVHGEHVYFVENEDSSIQEAVEHLMKDHDLRCHLEQQMSKYWTQYGTPEASIHLLGI